MTDRHSLDNADKPHVSIAFGGSVDSGKSSSVGRLIFELGGISEREMQKLREEADNLGKSSFAFAFYMDRQKEERARGVTIVCTTKDFYTETKHFTVLDCPGHRDYISNYLSGASQADAAVLLVPADGNFTTSIAKENHKAGVIQGQSRQHAMLFNLLGIKQLIVGVNKMDADVAKYSQERFKEIRNEVVNMLSKIGWKKDFVKNNVPIIPYSAWQGDNLLTKSDKMPWWEGQEVTRMDGTKCKVVTILDAFDKMVQIPARQVDANLRVPISGIYKIKGVGDVLTGRVEQGSVKPGQEVVFHPTHAPSTPCAGKVFTVEMHHKSVAEALPGDNVGLNIKGLNKENIPRTGDVMVLKNDTSLGRCTQFVAQVQILNHPGELKVGYSPLACIRTAKGPCRLAKINWKVGKDTGGQKVEDPVLLKAGDMAEVVFEPKTSLVVDTFKNCEGLGRVAMMEGNGVVMLGKVVKTVYE